MIRALLALTLCASAAAATWDASQPVRWRIDKRAPAWFREAACFAVGQWQGAAAGVLEFEECTQGQGRELDEDGVIVITLDRSGKLIPDKRCHYGVASISQTPGSGRIGGVVVAMNQKCFDWRRDPVLLKAVLVHEIGHALGLEHSEHPEATMWPTGQERGQSLHPEDVAAFKKLYGGG